MMYTVRYAHLHEAPGFRIGDIVRRGEIVGIGGNTGKSTGRHLHIDCVRGKYQFVYRMSDMESGRVTPEPRQLNWFIDNELFGSPIAVTSYYCDHRYLQMFKVMHYAYDVVPLDRKSWIIKWNRSMNGEVSGIGFDAGYGFFITIIYEV